jgi:hypothetical protein
VPTRRGCAVLSCGTRRAWPDPTARKRLTGPRELVQEKQESLIGYGASLTGQGVGFRAPLQQQVVVSQM